MRNNFDKIQFISLRPRSSLVPLKTFHGSTVFTSVIFNELSWQTLSESEHCYDSNRVTTSFQQVLSASTIEKRKTLHSTSENMLYRKKNLCLDS